MKKHYYTVMTTEPGCTTASGTTHQTFEDALNAAFKGTPLDKKGDGFKIDQYELIGIVTAEGRLRDGAGRSVEREVTTDIGHEGIRFTVDKLLAKFDKVQSVECKIDTRAADINPEH